MAPRGGHAAPERVGAWRAGFGTFVAWFLLGGDLYTAYTFIAVPAAMFGAGAVQGWFAVSTPTTSHWAGSVDTIFGHTVYIGLSAIIINVAVTVVLTLVFKAASVPAGADETRPHEYKADPVEAPATTRAGVGAY
jgi:solute:Na+ symporter, SSS family